MTPDEIIQAYNVVVDDIRNKNAQEAARIGNAQASLGLMAERVARPSGTTSGLANYTYNRTMRPVVEQSTAALTTTGLVNALDNGLKTQLREAKNRYENAKNNYPVSSTGGGGGGGGGKGNHEERVYGGNNDGGASQIPYTAKGTIIGTGSTGNGLYDIIVADGKGGSTIHQYYGPSKEEALSKYRRDYGYKPSSSATTGSAGKGFSGGGGGGGGGGGR